MRISIVQLEMEHAKDVLEIFNYYVENTFAAYPENPLPEQAARRLIENCNGYPAFAGVDENGKVAGFCMLRPYNPFSVFAETAEITYFIAPEYTGSGIGSRMLEHLEKSAREKGIRHILASISSLNEGSVRFHLRKGFMECGRFRDIGRKKGRNFDVIYLQKDLL